MLKIGRFYDRESSMSAHVSMNLLHKLGKSAKKWGLPWSLINKTKLCYGPASPVHICNVWTINMQSSNIKEWNLFELQITHMLQ